MPFPSDTWAVHFKRSSVATLRLCQPLTAAVQHDRHYSRKRKVPQNAHLALSFLVVEGKLLGKPLRQLTAYVSKQ